MPATVQHIPFEQPADNTLPVWRYVDLSKYLDLLCNRRIFFPRADLLGDPFEGSVPAFNTAVRGQLLDGRRSDPTKDPWPDLSDEHVNQMYQTISQFNRQTVKDLFVSCWHMNESESTAMWRLYSKSDESICIRSAYNRLVELFPDYVFPGVVKYIDYSSQFVAEDSLLRRFMYKRKSFEHERECGFVIWRQYGNTPKFEGSSLSGMSVDVEPSLLVDAIYVNPISQPWFAELVGTVTQKLGYSFAVRKSTLADEPLY
jgi:hypothetical protein